MTMSQASWFRTRYTSHITRDICLITRTVCLVTRCTWCITRLTGLSTVHTRRVLYKDVTSRTEPATSSAILWHFTARERHFALLSGCSSAVHVTKTSMLRNVVSQSESANQKKKTKLKKRKIKVRTKFVTANMVSLGQISV